MKKIAGILLTGFVLLNSYVALAQTYAESALMFSRINPGGSSRIQALGGAQVSLGGDYSSAFANPAGLGMFNRSEFTISPGVVHTGTSSDYLGGSTGDAQTKFILPGLSGVFHSGRNNGSWGFSINRISDFNRNFTYTGVNHNSSIMDYFAANANSYGQTPDQLFYDNATQTPGTLYNDPTGLAYNNYLINPVLGSANGTDYAVDTLGHFAGNALGFFGVPTQRERVQTKGSQIQVSISYGANFNDKFFLGGGVGLTSLDFTSRKTYTETFQGDSALRSMALTENLHTSGSGLNATIGAIYRPVDFFQTGFSIATPTIYLLNDTYISTMTSTWNHFLYSASNPTAPDKGSYSTDQVLATYGLNTPWRVSGGVTFFIMKKGFVTADVEYVNYSSSKYSAQVDGGITGNDVSYYNQTIHDTYRPVFNYRLGAEYRWKSYRGRIGYSYMPDPYRAFQNVDNKLQSFSGGVGYRTTKFYVDLTAILRQGTNSYLPYTGAPDVTTVTKVTTVMVTVGFPF